MSLLRKLRNYFTRQHFNLAGGGIGAEAMSQSVFANQFVSGLQPELKSKIVGTEGNLEQLLRSQVVANPNRSTPHTIVLPCPNSSNTSRSFTRQQVESNLKCCFNCGMVGHLRKSCPYPKYTKLTQEIPGRPTQRNTPVANLICSIFRK